MTRRQHEKYLLRFALSLTIVAWTFSPHTSAQDGPSAIPEGSGSIIQPFSLQFTSEIAMDLA